MPTNDLPDQIKKAQQWQSSRYEIDKGLLDNGYNPNEIETAWQQIEVKPSRKQLSKLRLALLVGEVVAVLVAIYLLLQHISSSYISWESYMSAFALIVMSSILLWFWWRQQKRQ